MWFMLGFTFDSIEVSRGTLCFDSAIVEEVRCESVPGKVARFFPMWLFIMSFFIVLSLIFILLMPALDLDLNVAVTGRQCNWLLYLGYLFTWHRFSCFGLC